MKLGDITLEFATRLEAIDVIAAHDEIRADLRGVGLCARPVSTIVG